MAKAPSADRFMITCQVAAVDMGPIVAQLTRMGLTNVSFELITDVPRYAQRRPVDGPSSDELLRAWIKDHPTFKAIEAVKHFEANGRTKGNAYPALSKLVEEKVLKQLGQGNYARADVKHIEGPKKKAKAAKVVSTHDKYKVKNPEALLRIARRNHGRFTSELAKKHFDVLGRPITAVGPTINRLLQDKLIRRTAAGTYELTAKGEDHGRKPNGAAPPPLDVVVEQPVES